MLMLGKEKKNIPYNLILIFSLFLFLQNFVKSLNSGYHSEISPISFIFSPLFVNVFSYDVNAGVETFFFILVTYAGKTL